MLAKLAQGNQEIITQIFDQYQTLDLELQSGETLLTKSIKKFPITITRRILEKANPNLVNSRKESPLLLAIQRQSWELFDLLIAKGADINLVYNNTQTVLDYLYQRREFDQFFDELVIKNALFKQPQESLHFAVIAEHYLAIVYVLQKGAQLSIAIENLKLFKSLAIRINVFSYLLPRYFFLTRNDILFLLEYLAEHREACTLLQNYLPDFIVRGRSNFMHALMNEDEEKIQLYLRIDFNYHHKDEEGKPFLFYLIDKRRHDLVDMFLQKGYRLEEDGTEPLKYVFDEFVKDADQSLILIAQLFYAANCDLGFRELIPYGKKNCPALLNLLLNTKLAFGEFKNNLDFITLEDIPLRSILKIEWNSDSCFKYSLFSLKKYLRSQNFFNHLENNDSYLFKIPPCFYITGRSAFLILSSLQRNYQAQPLRLDGKTGNTIYQLSSST